MNKKLSGRVNARRFTFLRIAVTLVATSVIVLVLLVAINGGKGKNRIAEENVARTVETPRATPTVIAQPSPMQSIMPAVQSEYRLDYTQKVFLTMMFACDDAIEREMDMPRDWVGMTQEEFELTHPEMRVITFEADVPIKLERTFSYCCPQHYVLMIDGDGLGVYHTNGETFQPMLLQRISFDLEVLSAEVYTHLLEGVPFDTIVEMEAFLEDLDT